MKKQRAVLFAIVFALVGLTHVSLALESTSTSFEIHAGNAQMLSGTSSSSSFGTTTIAAAGQNAIGLSSSSTKASRSGVLYWFFSYFTERYDQIHFRWRNDDGSETTATWAANQDIQYVNFPKNTIKRIRFEISNEGWTRGLSVQYTLEVAQTTTCSSGSYASVPTSYGSAWVIATSSNFTDGAATTNQLSAEGATFVAGQMKRTGNTTSAISLTSENFTEIEYAVLATSAATDGATYCFRLTNNGSTTNFSYSQYATAVLSSGLPATGELYSAVFETTGSAAGPAYNSFMWKGTLGNGSQGKVRFQFAASDSSTGPWTYYGGSACNTSDWFETTGPDAPYDLQQDGCSSLWNNKRYFRYRVQLCSSDCVSSGQYTPTVTDIVVNWSP